MGILQMVRRSLGGTERRGFSLARVGGALRPHLAHVRAVFGFVKRGFMFQPCRHTTYVVTMIEIYHPPPGPA